MTTVYKNLQNTTILNYTGRES